MGGVKEKVRGKGKRGERGKLGMRRGNGPPNIEQKSAPLLHTDRARSALFGTQVFIYHQSRPFVINYLNL